MKASARAFGAATIVNAIATGKGAAFGIGLKTEATVELNDSGKIVGNIIDSPKEDTKLIEICARIVLEKFHLKLGAKIETESCIPIAAGLKSSSTAANAVVLATIEAARQENNKIKLSDHEILDLAVDAALEAKVTITGAYDDASASYFGGAVVTDNMQRKILNRWEIDTDLAVVIFVPEQKIYTATVDVKRTKLIAEEVEIAWKEALNKNIYTAMKLNGLLYSAAFQQNPEIAFSAVEAGAISAGLSGKGPAVVALTRDDPEEITDAWSEFEGITIVTKVNNTKAGIV